MTDSRRTDMMTEANDTKEAMFGEMELMRTMNEDADAKPEDIVRRVGNALDRFTSGAPQFDDITMMCVKYYGATEFSMASSILPQAPLPAPEHLT